MLINKYYNWYYNIINKAKSRGPISAYTEEHHIIPECFFINRSRPGPKGHLEGNPEDPSNLVQLTAREHFICHMLLPKFTEGPSRYKMLSAAMWMTPSKGNMKNRYVNSRLYEAAKKEFSRTPKPTETRAKISAANKGRKAHNKGKPHSAETRAKISAANKGKPSPNKGNTGIIVSSETRAKLSAVHKGRKHSADHIAKVAAANRGKKRSDEIKAKISNTKKGSPAPNKGKPHSAETRAKMVAAWQKRKGLV